MERCTEGVLWRVVWKVAQRVVQGLHGRLTIRVHRGLYGALH